MGMGIFWREGGGKERKKYCLSNFSLCTQFNEKYFVKSKMPFVILATELKLLLSLSKYVQYTDLPLIVKLIVKSTV